MRRRRLGSSDLELTTIGLGTWAIGGHDWRFGWGPQDDEQAVAALLRGLELGINWIDTAAVYGDGHAEVLVGRALAALAPADRPIVATKCGRLVNQDGTIRGDLSRESVLRECERSLERLGVDVIDLYQVHWPDPDEQVEEGWSAVCELVDQGKVRYGGVSNFNRAQLDRALAIRSVASLQPKYNLLYRDAERELFATCAEHAIGIVAYSPLAKGLLTGKFTRERAEALGDDDHRSRDPDFQDPRLTRHLALVDELRAIAARHDRTPAELAIAWVLRRPEVTSAIVGARSPRQIEETASAADWTLDAESIAAIEDALG